MDGAVVTFTDVHKRFGEKRVLTGFDLEVRRGETLALLGRSGQGKSVTLKLMLGLVRPDQGRVVAFDEDVGGLSERQLAQLRRRMGMVFQGGALFDSLTVGENVAYSLVEHRSLKRGELGKRIAECLEMVDLPGTDKLLPEQLSGGMRKRVAIARAIANAPEVLLYDEPTAGLDPSTAGQVNRLIRHLQQRLGVTSLVVTHDMESCFTVADRVALLGEGKMIWTGDVETARNDPPEPLRRFIEGEAGERNPWRPTAATP